MASASPRTPRSTTREQLPGCPRRRRRTALPRPFTTSSVFTSRGALRAAGKVAIRIPLWAWARHWSGDKGIAAGPVPRSAPSQCDVESLDHDGRDVTSRPYPRIRKAVQNPASQASLNEIADVGHISELRYCESLGPRTHTSPQEARSSSRWAISTRARCPPAGAGDGCRNVAHNITPPHSRSEVKRCPPLQSAGVAPTVEHGHVDATCAPRGIHAPTQAGFAFSADTARQSIEGVLGVARALLGASDCAVHMPCCFGVRKHMRKIQIKPLGKKLLCSAGFNSYGMLRKGGSVE